MSGILEIAQEQLPELVVMPEGEARVQIDSAKEKVFQSGREGWMVALRIADRDDAETIFHNVMKPHESDTPRTHRMMVQGAQEFVAAFGIASDDTEAWVGKEAWAILGLDEYEGREKNVIKRFISGPSTQGTQAAR